MIHINAICFDGRNSLIRKAAGLVRIGAVFADRTFSGVQCQEIPIYLTGTDILTDPVEGLQVSIFSI